MLNTIGYVTKDQDGQERYEMFNQDGNSMLALARSAAMVDFLVEMARFASSYKMGKPQQDVAISFGNIETARRMSDKLGQLIETRLSDFLARKGMGLEEPGL